MSKRIKEKRGITLISLVVTIILLLILAAVSIAMLMGDRSFFGKARTAKENTEKAEYKEIIKMAQTEDNITTDRLRGKETKLNGIAEILNKDKKLGEGTGTQITKEYQDKENPRLVVKTKENWVYIVTVDGIKELGKVDGDIPLDIDVKNGDIKYIYEPNYWTNSDVEVSLSIAKEEYKEFKIQYSYDLKTWKDYTEKIVVENNKAIYSRITTGTSVSESYATGNVINIDKKEAEISTALNSSKVTTKGFIVNVGVTDENSGLGKIVWYYKKSDATSYTSEEVIYKDLHSVQSGEITAVTKSKTYDNLTSGTYDVYAEIYDVAGNVTSANSSDKPLEITLGTVTGLTEANTTFKAEPSDWTNGNVIVTASTDVSGYTLQTSKDAKTWTSISTQEFETNGKVYARLWDGINAGGYSVGNVTNIDKLAPNSFTPTATSTTNSITVTASTTDATATDDYASSGIAGYRFKLDSGSWSAYQTSGTYKWSNLTQTTNHTITVEAKDTAGNTKQGTVSKGTGTVTGLTTANTKFTAEPTGWTNGNVIVTASTDVSGYTLQTSKDAKTWTSISTQEFKTNGKVYARLWDGINAGGYSVGNVTNIDKLAPNSFAPTATSTTNSITVTASTTDATATDDYASSGIAGYRFKLDSGSWSAYQTSGTYKWSNLTQTTNHTITVEAKDTAGNTKQGTVSKGTGTVAGLTTANTRFAYNPSSATNGNVAVTITTDVTEYKLQYKTSKTGTSGSGETSSWKDYTGVITLTRNEAIYARVIDTTGQSATIYATGNVTNIDKLAPNGFTPTATSTTNSITVTASTTDATATDDYASSGIAGYRFKLDSGSWSAYQTSGTYKWSNLTQTTNHIITVEVKDNAGNTKQATATKGTGTVAGLTTANTRFAYNPSSATNGNVAVKITTDVTEYKLQYKTSKTGTSGSGETSSWKDYTGAITLTRNEAIYARVIDTTGQSATVYATGNVTNIDKLAPNSFTPTATSTTNSITVTASTTDATATDDYASSGIAGYRFKLDSGSWSAYQTSGTYKWSNLTQTTNHTITVEAKDNAGNTKQGTVSKGTGTVAGLTTANTRFAYNPSSATNGNVAVTITTDVTEYKLQYKTSKTGSSGSGETSSWKDYTGAITLTRNEAIYARVIDTTGQSATVYATGNVTNIDKLAPNSFTPTATSTTNSITVTASTTDATATDDYASSGIAGYRFKLDSGSWSAYQTSGKYKWSNLTQTTNHTITVEAKDNAGNTKQGTVSKGTGTVSGLTTANTRFKAEPTGWTKGNVAVKIETDVTGYKLQYKTEKTGSSGEVSNWTDYTEAITVERNQAIYARVIDTTGQSATVYATGNVTNIDKLAPNGFTPTATSTANSIKVRASTTDAEATSDNGKSGISGYRFRLDSGSWTGYQTSGEYTWNNLIQNTTYTITVEAKDTAGNTKQTTVSEKTDVVPTVGRATSTPTGWTNGNVTVTLPTISGFTTRYTTNGTKPATSSTAYSSSFKVSSNCTITYIYTDGTNIGGAGTLNITNIDTLKPNDFTPTATSTTNSITVKASTTDADATSTSGKSGISGYRFRLDSGSWTGYQTSGEYTWNNLIQNTTYTITVEAKDTAGNTKQTTVSEKTDVVPTVGRATSTPTGWTNGNVTVTLPIISGFTTRYTTNGTKPTTSSTAYSSSFTVSSNCTITYIYTDGTNIGGAGTLSITNIDTVVPNAFTPTATSTTKSVTVKASTTDADATSTSGKSGISGYRFRLDSGSWTGYQTSGEYTWSNLTQTTNHTITVEAKDTAGNTRKGTVSKGTGTIETASGGSFSPTGWTNGNVTVTLPTKSGFTTRYTTNGTKPSTSSTAYSSSFTVSSNCTITYIYTDGINIGGAGTLNITNIDKTAPGAVTVKYNGGSNTCSWKNNYNLTLSASDSQSGIDHYEIDWDGDGNSNKTTGSNFIPWDGYTSCQNRFRAVDKVGNKGPWTGQHHIHMDTTPPNAPTEITGYKVLAGEAVPHTWDHYSKFYYDGTNLQCVNNGDARIVFTDTTYINPIKSIRLGVTSNKRTKVQVFYSYNGEAFSEAQSVTTYVPANTMSVSVINLPKETRYRTLRIDIGENNEVYTIHTLDFLSNYSTYHWSQWIRHLLSNNDSRFWKYQYKLGNGQWTDMASNEYVFTTVGTYTIQYRVVDLAGNASPSITRTVNRTSN